MNNFLQDPIGKPGLGFIAAGQLLQVLHQLVVRADITYWVGIVCTTLGGIYYLLKIYFDYIKKKQK